MFKDNEQQPEGFSVPLSEALDNLAFNDAGLVPVIAQQHDTGEVLMFAWMNRAAIEETLATGQVCYYSRSRKTLWRKGESSGQTQTLKALRVDCDGDVLLASVEQTGAACHTGRRDCFFWKLDNDTARIDKSPLVDPKDLYDH
ncbi:MAG: phosphoribosyl-AMP cyclohydrolase [Alcanivorax sp.]|jgi:phosphoribosyl-AMP cyclohydrolase|uniref:Phosphoribosyl-AMP cyclohydrolase n=1 Tax=Alloalcanivorax venustensis ISO4 TaxID=1177184 RepID=A0ABS0AH27_9GAMM|nr:phosphoribosyl-AMP cyclohydrolase [Alloalcanivorax venustensis]MAK21440.1 phosphoribosyl-AMP cyclohydrolase [Alcanivorax sp.]MCH9783906.1 phosphoribosyl-AMP cyclohydrolase [Gammaproteobacteria bacterium]MEA3258888.1 phosphoribosyl-AMP cyclohydrolase [Pseudomonadota bacterium]SMO33926.1 phosphoribosyl-AMP cyclohydrolase [Alcanivorax sp. DSM 26295]MAQ35378.1 phosphoribosyl-AMP cyclohydrolase [Alcanivorax sp.]|tara:strand:- start:134231 stop:134659 length:429 start_codon:yes stop_codon:yes gene_type:complete